nr:hypothetical protein [Ktedonobacterales bacterium]
VEHWLGHYWRKLNLPEAQLDYLAITSERREFALWTGRRLNPMALGCYCYLPLPPEGAAEPHDVLNHLQGSAAAPTILPLEELGSLQMTLPGFAPPGAGASVGVAVLDRPTRHEPITDFRHLIFIEPDLLPLGIEVTVAHELIHLSDRVRGTPRKHRCHGHDSISVDEAAITGHDPELLRELLRDETTRRELKLRALRPNRYLYLCPNCDHVYRRVRLYPRMVSCGRCDHHYNPLYLLRLHALLDKAGNIERLVTPEEADSLTRATTRPRR